MSSSNEPVSAAQATPAPLEALFRPALILMSGRFLGFIAAFGIPLVLVRIFDQSEFGTYKQIFLIFGTLFGVAQVGMAESLYYFLPQESKQSGGFVFNTMLVLGILGSFILLALWLARYEVATFMNNPELSEYMLLAGLFLLFMLMAVLLEILMTVRKQHLAASCSYALSDLVRALFYLCPVLVFASLRTLMLGAVAFAAARLAATVLYVRREFKTGLRPDRQALSRHLSYAVPFGLAAFIEVVQINYHMYAVSHYFDTATFAIYAVGCLQIPLSDFLMTSTCNVMMVNMREKILNNDLKSAAAIWLDSVRKLALIFFPLVACLLIVAKPLIVLLFTQSYIRSVPIFMLWTLSMLFATLLTDGALRVFAATRFLIVQNTIRLLLIIALIPWFLQQFGLIGAIMVTLLAVAVGKVIALIWLRRIMQISVQQLLPWKSLVQTFLIASIAAIPALLVQSLLAKSTPVDSLLHAPELLLTGLIYSVSYYLLLRWYGPMHVDEKQMLNDWLKFPIVWLGRVCKV